MQTREKKGLYITDVIKAGEKLLYLLRHITEPHEDIIQIPDMVKKDMSKCFSRVILNPTVDIIG